MDTIVPQKRCYACQKFKPLSDFGNNRSKPDGKARECKLCKIQINKSYKERPKNSDLSKKAEDLPDGYKRCTSCKKVKYHDKFHRTNDGGKYGVKAKCKECHKNQDKVIVTPEYNARRHLLRKFNLTHEEYEEMLTRQLGVCAICGNPPKNRRLQVDHCHKTGRIRALLCISCNTMLGHVNDNIDTLYKAISYLEEHGL